MSVSRREGFVQLGQALINLRCVEMVYINPGSQVVVALTSGRTVDLYDDDAVDFLALLGDYNDIVHEAQDAWQKREREADEPLEGPDW